MGSVYSRAKYTGTALPAISEVVTLYTTPAVAGTASNFFEQGGVHKVVLNLKNDQAGTLAAQKSADGGTTWLTIYSESIGATSATDVVHRQYPIEGVQDFRLRWTNGATAQTTFAVDVALSDNAIDFGTDPTATAGLGTVALADGSATFGTAVAGADAVANPTLGRLFGYMQAFNGTTWDRVRTAVVAKVAASGATGILNSLILGRYNLTPATLTDGDVQLLQLDAAGNARTADQFMPAAEDNTVGVIKVEQRFSYTRMVTQTTTLIKSGAGFLHALVINTPLANGTIELDDALTNTTPIIGKVTLPAALVSGPTTLIYDVSFATGLSVTVGAANVDITLVWR